MLRRVRFAGLVLLLLAGASTLPPTADAVPSRLGQGLAVVTSPVSFDHAADLTAGETVFVYVVADSVDLAPIFGIRSFQFGVEVDPRLEILGRFPTEEANFVDNPTPDDWRVGLRGCLGSAAGPVVLMTYQLRLPVAQAPARDLRVDLRPLLSGEEMLFGPCADPTDLRRFEPAGGVVLNPTRPAVLHVSGSPSLLVEGRPLLLAWETLAADLVTLDGTTVPAAGRETFSPAVSTTYTVAASSSAGTDSASWRVTVIREPRVDVFTAETFTSGNQLRVQLTWDVRGAESVEVEGVGAVNAHGGAVVPLQSPPVWALTATNEWGSTVAAAGLPGMEQQPPLVIFFVASPNPFRSGEAVTLRWSLFDATAASIAPDIGAVDPIAGTITVAPTVSSTYTLTASNEFGTTTQDLLVQLLPPGILSFVADPPEIFPGQSTTLRWSVESGLDLTISPGVGAVSGATGSVVVTPPAHNTLYILTATNPAGSVSSQLRVAWKPPSVALATTNAFPFATETITLTATVDGATSASLEPGIGPIPATGGSFEVLVETPTVFVLTATNARGSSQAELGVTPKPPTARLTTPTATPFPDEPAVLEVVVEGFASARLEPIFGAIPGSGTYTTFLDSVTTFVLTAESPAGVAVDSLTFTPQPPEIVTFTATPAQLLPGQSATLQWEVRHADDVVLQPLGLHFQQGLGQLIVAPDSTTTYTLTATNGAGTSSASALVERLGFSIVSFTATPERILSGEETILAWEVVGDASVTLEGFGLQPKVGSLAVRPTQTTSYTLVVSDGRETRRAQVTVFVGSSGTGAIVLSWSNEAIPGTPPTILPFVPFRAYVLSFEPDGGILGFEFGVEFPTCLIVLSSVLPTGSINFGQAPYNYLVGTGGICLEGTFVQLVEFLMIVLDEECTRGNNQIRLIPAKPSSFDPPSPGYLTCLAQGDIRPFDVGGPLPLSGGGPPGVPAAVLQLAALPQPAGIRLEWQLAGVQGPFAMTVWRGRDSSALRPFAHLDGVAAASSWLDTDVTDGVPYRYRLVADLDAGPLASQEVVATWTQTEASPPLRTRLLANVPNPFNPRTDIRYELSRRAAPLLEIYDTSGRRIRRVQLPAQEAGIHAWTWQGETDAGRSVSSGVYYVRLSAGGEQDVHRIALVR